MRIKKIEIQNFRAFYGNFEIELGGKNLLLYGENGSGKSSLFYALKLFLESANAKTEFSEHRNIFVKDDDDGFVKLTIGKNAYEWLPAKFPDAPIILDANKTKGFLDYKSLLETHFLHSKQEEKSVNLFHLLVENLLANYTESSSGRTIGDIWQSVQQKSKAKKNTNTYKREYPEELHFMNDVLQKGLANLTDKTNELLAFFDYQVICKFSSSIDLESISLDVKFFDRSIPSHHDFLNEARLSAIALSIYFASLLEQPKSDLRILALDDVLVGLDMANRLPVIDILEQHFSEHQIFFITHDKLWFDMMKMRTESNKAWKWKYAEFYCPNDVKSPILPIDYENDLERANKYLSNGDYKAAAVYARTAFEIMLKNFCDNKKLSVRYCKDVKKLQSEDFWQAVRNFDGLTPELISNVELYRAVVLNPLSHSRIIEITKNEVGKAIEAIEQLENALDMLKNDKKSVTTTEL
jgi:energy-coupling factor transporter ATP-binding protein EcfA2